MSSADFTFITLRNITAYQPTGSFVPNHYVLNMSTNGNAVWTNTLQLQNILGSTMIGSTIYGGNMGCSNMSGSTIVGSTIVGNNLVALSSIVVTTALFSTNTDYTYTGSNAISSMLIAIGDNVWKIPVEFVESIPT